MQNNPSILTKNIRAKITAVGTYVPPYVLTNEALAQMCATDDAWIRERTGVIKRHILNDGRASSDMGAEALKVALEKAALPASAIELLICATVTPDMVFPATANIICDKVGAKNVWGFDLEAACSGFLFALSTAAQFIETGRYQTVAVVGVDKMSSIIDYQDRNVAVLFGDGAGAVILTPDSENGVQDFALYSDGAGRKYLHQKAGGSARPASAETVLAGEHFVFQDGKPVFRAAIEGMSAACLEIMQRNGLTAENIAYLLPHQANRRIIEATAQRMELPIEKVVINIHKYGNTTAATLPLCLAEIAPQLKIGDKLILASFGGGFTWGALYLTWG